ncbi:MAG: hypothetical protein ACREOZ_03155, partial [Gloeomargaritales cyanobacterium]
MPSTRSTVAGVEEAVVAAADVDHVLKEVLGLGSLSPIYRALIAAGVESMLDVMDLSLSDLAELEYHPANDISTVKKLSIVEQNKIVLLQKWYSAQEDCTIVNWMELTPKAFQLFCAAGTVNVPASVG